MLSLLCSFQRTVLALVLLRHLFAPSPRSLWPYVSLAFPLVGLNQEAGLSIPLAALPRSLSTGTTEPGSAGLGPVQRQRCHQGDQPRCLGEFWSRETGRSGSQLSTIIHNNTNNTAATAAAAVSSHGVFLSVSCTLDCFATALEFNNNLQRHVLLRARVSSSRKSATLLRNTSPALHISYIISHQCQNTLNRYNCCFLSPCFSKAAASIMSYIYVSYKLGAAVHAYCSFKGIL